MFHFGSTCSAKIIHKKINNSCQGFSCSLTSCNGIRRFSHMQHLLLSAHAVHLRCCLYHAIVYGSFVSRFAHATVQHVTASISPRGNHEDIQPASGGIIHAVCRFLQSCSNVRRMSCFWWQLTHNITFHITRLSLKKSCFEINMQKGPIPCWLPFDSSFEIRVLWKQANQSVSIPSACPGNLSIPIWPWPEEVIVLVRLDGEHSSSGHIISWLDLPHVDEIKKLRCPPRICTQDVLLQRIVCSILVLLGLMLLFVHEISFWLLFLLPFRR